MPGNRISRWSVDNGDSPAEVETFEFAVPQEQVTELVQAAIEQRFFDLDHSYTELHHLRLNGKGQYEITTEIVHDFPAVSVSLRIGELEHRSTYLPLPENGAPLVLTSIAETIDRLGRVAQQQRATGSTHDDAAVPPPEKATPWEDDRNRCERPGEFAVDVWTVAGVRVGASTFADAQSRLGKMEPIRVSREETAPKVLCYRLSDGPVVVYESSVMASVKGGITAIALLDPSFVPFVERCVSADAEVATTTPSGTAPGASRGSFEEAAGTAYCQRDAKTTAWHLLKENGKWSTMTRLQAHFVDDKLRWWYVYRVESK